MAAIAKAENLPRTVAMREARERYPILFESWQSAGTVIDRSHFAKSAPPVAVLEFERLVSKIRHERKLSGTEAMAVARREHPAEYEAYQSS